MSLWPSIAPALVTPRQYSDPDRHLKFLINGSPWEFFENDNDHDKSRIQFIARGAKASAERGPSALTFRLDSGKWKSARQYSERWLKEYPKFGYELQLSQETRYGALQGFEMILSSTSSGRIVRQFIVTQPEEVWVFTCSGPKEQFTNIWPDCEKILKSAALSAK